MDYTKLYNEMLNNYVNGNRKDFTSQFENLTRLEIVNFIAYVKGGQNETDVKLHQVLAYLSNVLQEKEESQNTGVFSEDDIPF